MDAQALPRHRLTVGVNPLPIVAGRYGLNLEIVPVRHHVLIASGWLQTFLNVTVSNWLFVMLLLRFGTAL